ncbi:C39 family peptidase [Holdemanella biformis]|uniref:C39 family peptidase n=1 Tax=Holdemanella biformis TaxID=1735 RepID=UPI002E78F96F|nr:C39 family peptidase [Holdemanella biformis]MEE0667491.1 C39 family peptidase [Holdemanella biformis]
MGFKKLAWIPMFMILSAGMPILADETEVQEPVEEQTETTLGWNETHDMYTKEDGSFAIGWQEIDQEMYYFNESGILQCDQWIDNHYVGFDGRMAKNQWINDRYVDSNGLWQQNRWVNNGKWLYRYGDGTYAQNKFEVINGSTYYFDADGYMVTGWSAIESNWYYFNASGCMVTNAWVGNYYLGSDGVMARNTWIDNVYVDASGLRQQNGWIYNGRWWYRYGDGSYPCSKFDVINGSTYYFDDAGYMVTGWKSIESNWYYFNASGCMVTNAWVGNYYLGSDGVMATNQWIGNYYVKENGSIATNEWIGNDYVDASGKWVPNRWISNGRWWYRYGDGSYPASKFDVINGSTYYFDKSGYMVTGWKSIESNWYYFNASGCMVTNTWVGDYYLDFDGKMAISQWINDRYVGQDGAWDKSKELYVMEQDSLGTRFVNQRTLEYEKDGWIKIKSGSYYVDSNGYALVGTQILEDKPYHFDEIGKLITGWYMENEHTYWLDTNGQKISGWKFKNSIWYYFDSNTFEMACSGWQQVGSGMYYFLSDGTMKQDWLLLNGSDWYYLGQDGARKTGLVTLDSNSFYFYVENDSNGGSVGLMAANRTITLGSKTLYIDGSGYIYRSDISNIPYLSQVDYRWKNTSIGYSTIGSSGCLPSTAAMIINYYKGTNYTPVDIARQLYSAGYMNTPTYFGSTSDSYKVVQDNYGLSYQNNLSYSQLIGCLKGGKLVAAAVGKGDFVYGYGITHVILLAGYNNGYVYVYDPLDPYKNGYYSIDSIWNQQSSDYGDLQNGGPFFAF